METNWTVIRNEYETLGLDVKELSKRHHVAEALINAAIQGEGWEQSDIGGMDAEAISAKLEALELQNQTQLVPQFISLQAKMLKKCDMLLDSVDALDDANNLKIVSEVIEKHRPAILGNKDDKSDNAITVKIMSQVGDGAAVAVNAVEVTSKAGETNGLGQGVPHGTPLN